MFCTFSYKIPCKYLESFVDNQYFNWDDVSENIPLDEWFILKYQNKVKWYKILRYQKLSYDFIKKCKTSLDDCVFDILYNNCNLDIEVRNKLLEFKGDCD